MKKVTVVLPMAKTDLRVANVLQQFVGAGLVRPFGLFRASNDLLWMNGSDQTIYGNLNDFLTKIQECDLLRLICFTASTSPFDSSRATDDIEAIVNSTKISTDRSGIKTVFGGVYLCADGQQLPSDLFGEYCRYFNYNLVILPEDGLGERNSPTLRLTTGDCHEMMANALAVVGGLWRWLDDAPLDQMRHSGDNDRQRVRFARVATRMTKLDDLVSDAIANALDGDGKSMLPRDCVHHRWPESAVDELHSVLTGRNAVSPVGFSYRPYSSPSQPSRKTLGIGGALRLFLEELLVELPNVPRAVVENMKDSIRRRTRKIEGRMEELVADRTFGRDSSIIVRLRDNADLDLTMDPSARCRELDKLSDVEDFRAISTPGIWSSLTNAIISAADGGSFPPGLGWDGLEWKGQRAVIEDPKLLAPDLRNAPAGLPVRPHDVQAIRAILDSAE